VKAEVSNPQRLERPPSYPFKAVGKDEQGVSIACSSLDSMLWCIGQSLVRCDGIISVAHPNKRESRMILAMHGFSCEFLYLRQLSGRRGVSSIHSQDFRLTVTRPAIMLSMSLGITYA
jgi:hypothetical protein